MAPTIQTKESVKDYRVERFADLRFNSEEAEKLAESVDADGFPIDWHKVRKALDAGCTHPMAVWIFSRED